MKPRASIPNLIFCLFLLLAPTARGVDFAAQTIVTANVIRTNDLIAGFTNGAIPRKWTVQTLVNFVSGKVSTTQSVVVAGSNITIATNGSAYTVNGPSTNGFVTGSITNPLGSAAYHATSDFWQPGDILTGAYVNFSQNNTNTGSAPLINFSGSGWTIAYGDPVVDVSFSPGNVTANAVTAAVTNQWLAAAAAAALAATNGYPWGSLYDAAGTASAATGALSGVLVSRITSATQDVSTVLNANITAATNATETVLNANITTATNALYGIVVPTNRTITIDGTAQDLSANRTYSSAPAIAAVLTPGTIVTNGFSFALTGSNSFTLKDAAGNTMVCSNGVIGTVRAITNTGSIQTATLFTSGIARFGATINTIADIQSAGLRIVTIPSGSNIKFCDAATRCDISPGNATRLSIGNAGAFTNTCNYQYLTNPVTDGGTFTNLTGGRLSVRLNYTLTAGAISGSPGYCMTNQNSGEWFNATNSGVLGLTASGSTSFLLGTNQVLIATNKSSAGGSVTLDGSFGVYSQ